MSIIVGVDGSNGSMDALRWAIDEARLRDTSVEAVLVWAFPYEGSGFGWIPTFDQETVDEVRREAEIELDRCVEAALDGSPDVVVTQTVVEGAPGLCLVERSRERELLVVGSRGFGGFKELLLGSVSHQCSLHAACPVVIVRHQAAVPRDPSVAEQVGAESADQVAEARR